MFVLFSQGPTSHSRIGNSLLWMARAFPHLHSEGITGFHFPWGFENFSSYYSASSIWICKQNASRASSLFSQAFGCELSAASLANIAQTLTCKNAKLNTASSLPENQIIDHLIANNVAVAFAYATGASFTDIVEQASSPDLLIIHEPFLLEYGEPRFPSSGLNHIHPNKRQIGQASAYFSNHGDCNNRVGLHVRRGDYQVWQNGKYYFPDQYWSSLALENLESAGQVFIFTNEPESSLARELVSLGCILSEGSSIEDLVRMMFMDRLVGPPSTFPLLARMIAASMSLRNILVSSLAPLG